MTELTEKKTPEQLGAEIRMYVDAGRRISLLCGIEIGKRLTQAKEMLDHGEWLPWLERETEFSSSSAQRYMKLFEEYGASQLGLFGPETNSPTLGNLPISKAFALLSVPESEREDFAEKVDAEHISVRELEQAIREKEAAERRAEKAERELQEAREDIIQAEENYDRRVDELAEAKARIESLSERNRELEARPVEVAVETVVDEKAVQEASRKAAEEASKEYEKKVANLQKKLSEAEKERDQAKTEAEASGSAAKKLQVESERAAQQLRAELEEAKKKLKTSDADVTAFKIRFNTIQSEWSYLSEELEKVRQRDPEKAEKLQEAVRQMLELFRKEVEKDV